VRLRNRFAPVAVVREGSVKSLLPSLRLSEGIAFYEADAMKVLVIDDDHLVRYTLSKILQRNGYDVTTASDGKRAMTVFRDARPDVVITDIIMPEQEGIETILKIRSERPEVKIIAISGGARNRNLGYLGMAEAFGADDVISKPFEAEELLSRLARFDLGASSVGGVAT
jgi:CheY-like chemotaxis protein